MDADKAGSKTDATGFLALARRRKSCRAYDPDRPVPTAAIRQCLEAARLAPSACNRQPWRFVVIRDAAKRQAIYERARLPGIAHEWLPQAPVIVALGVQPELVTHKLAPAISGLPYQMLDAGIAGEHFVLAATELGLGTCWIGWFKEKVVAKLLDVPRGVRLVSLIALGYPATATSAAVPKKRAEIDAFAFLDAWDNPLPAEED